MQLSNITSQFISTAYASGANTQENYSNALSQASSSAAGEQGSQPTAGGQTQSIIAGVNYIEEQIKDYMFSWPPFFPAGHPSRPDLVKGIKSVSDTIKTSSIDPTIKKAALSGETLPDNASDQEISSALGKLFNLRDTLVQHGVNQGPQPTGNLVRIKV